MIPTFTLGDRLRKAREVTGMSQVEFAEHIGIGRSTVQSYENGTTAPKQIALRAWAMATGVPFYWLQWGITEAPRRERERGFGILETAETPAHPLSADGAGASGEKLPRLDSNQQPAGYGSLNPRQAPGVVTDLGTKRRKVEQVQRVTRPKHLEQDAA